MHQQMNDVKRQQAQTARELEEVTAKLDKFLYMLEEVQNLPVNISYVSRETISRILECLRLDI